MDLLGVQLGPNYLCLRRLGQGAAGTVFECRHVTGGDSVAIKCIRRTGSPAKSLEQEVLNLRRLDHPHIIALKEVFLTPEFLCLVMEFATGGTLQSYIRQYGALPEDSARWFFQQLILAVDYSHRCGIVNRDIKLDNTLLMATSPPLLKISDFGLSKNACVSSPRSVVGTLRGGYIAPEVLEAQGNQPYDGRAADVWSCGVLLFFMVFGRGPFAVEQVAGAPVTRDFIRQMLLRQQNSQYDFRADFPTSDEVQHLLRQMLQPTALQRITVPGIMSHPWFTCGLPEGAAEMNAHYLDVGFAQQQGHQSEAAIRAILAELRRGTHPARHTDSDVWAGAAVEVPPGGLWNTLCIDDMIEGYMEEHPSAFEIPSNDERSD